VIVFGPNKTFHVSVMQYSSLLGPSVS